MSKKAVGKLKAKTFLNIKQVQDVDDLKRRAMTVAFYGAAGVLGYKFLLQPALRKYRMKHEQQSMLTDSNKQQATFFYNAMNPSGISWMRAIDYTDEDMIYAAARKVTDWNAVQSTYNNLYNRNLLSDLQSELSTSEYKTFLRILSSGKANRDKKNTQNARRGLIIASSKAVRLRSTPDSSYKSYSFNSNIYGTVTANTFLGWATGRVKVDNRGVKYIQVIVQFKDRIPSYLMRSISRKQKSKTLSFWVGAGAIYQFQSLAQLTESGIQIPKGVSNMGLKQSKG
jgi:hypothetical protein